MNLITIAQHRCCCYLWVFAHEHKCFSKLSFQVQRDLFADSSYYFFKTVFNEISLPSRNFSWEFCKIYFEQFFSRIVLSDIFCWFVFFFPKIEIQKLRIPQFWAKYLIAMMECSNSNRNYKLCMTTGGLKMQTYYMQRSYDSHMT